MKCYIEFNKRVKLFSVLLCLNLVAPCVFAVEVTECDRLAASTYDNSRPEGVAGVLFEAIDSQQAVPACEQAVKNNPTNSRLFYQLGRAYNKAERSEEAVSWFRKAADAGDSFGINGLGVMYRDGKGVTTDDAQAVSWFRKAVDAGNGYGMASLGWMYEQGRGVKKDDDKAKELYEQAAKLNDSWGQYYLCSAYQNAIGVVPDINQAKYWCRKAAAQGHSDAQKDYERLQKGYLTKAEAQEKTASQQQAVAPVVKEEKYDPCSHVYAGKVFEGKGGVFGITQTYEVVGFSSESGMATISQPHDRSYRQEVSCSGIPR